MTDQPRRIERGPADTGGLQITDPHEAGEAHGCPEQCPVHNPGGPDVPRDAVWGTWAPPPTDADLLLAVEGALEQVGDVVMQALEPLLGRLRAPATPGPARHVYLSTGCYHGNHGYCQNPTGLTGAKAPAACKFCGAPCICPCHRAADRATDTAPTFPSSPGICEIPHPTVGEEDECELRRRITTAIDAEAQRAPGWRVGIVNAVLPAILDYIEELRSDLSRYEAAVAELNGINTRLTRQLACWQRDQGHA